MSFWAQQTSIKDHWLVQGILKLQWAPTNLIIRGRRRGIILTARFVDRLSPSMGTAEPPLTCHLLVNNKGLDENIVIRIYLIRYIFHILLAGIWV